MTQNSDKVFIKNLTLYMSIGVYELEKKKKQRVIINAELIVDQGKAAESDNIDDTVSYEDVVNNIKSLAANQHFNLVESFAEQIARVCLEDERLEEITVRVEKPDVLGNDLESVGVEIRRLRNVK